MFKKILIMLLFVSSCTTYNRVPKAINKPKELKLGTTKTSMPFQEVRRESVYSDYQFIKQEEEKKEEEPKQEIVQKLFDLTKFSKPAISTPSSFTFEYPKEIEFEVIENEITPQTNDDILRVAVILPLETQSAQVAEDLQNASTMALFDAQQENTILQFYNSNGTYDNAKELAQNAIDDGADIIVGPLFAEEVKGAAKGASGTPIVSFTTDANALSGNVFSIGFLMEQQIKRVVEYAVENGVSKFGIIVADSESGDFVLDNFKKYVSDYGAEVVAKVQYKNKKNDLMNAVKEISDFENRKNEYNEYKQAVKERFDYLVALRDVSPEEYVLAYDLEQYLSTDDEVSFLEKTLEELEKKTTVSEPEYEAIFIFGDDINDVLMIGSSLMYYDVHPDRIKYLGTSQLENAKIYTERAFRGAWYPSVSTKYSGKFNSAYQKYFGRQPIKIASLAYDAVSLINSLAEDGEISKKDLLNPNGWTGINGIFRFKSNGSSERNMDIKEIVGGSITKTKVISPAPVNFIEY